MENLIGPTFLVVGAGKAGSTTLYYALCEHKDIYGCKLKEPMFFTINYKKGIDWYSSLFMDGRNHKHRFEASPQYTFVDEFPDVVNKIFEYNPRMKIVYIVRDPINRIISHFTHWNRTKPNVYRDINESLTDNSLRLPLIERTKYWKQITPYFNAFGHNNCKIVFLEDYTSDYRSTIKDLLNFLGLKFHDTRLFHSNPSNIKKRNQMFSGLNETIKNEILTELLPDSKRLLNYCGKKISFWSCFDDIG